MEVTIVGPIGPVLQSSDKWHLSSEQLGAVASLYVVGAVVGALLSGPLTVPGRIDLIVNGSFWLGAAEGMGELFGQLDELLVTLGVSGGRA